MLTWRALGKNVLIKVLDREPSKLGEAETGEVVQDNGALVVTNMTAKVVRWAEGTKIRFCDDNATWIDRGKDLAIINRDDILCIGEEIEDCADCGQPINGEAIHFMGTSARCRPCHEKRLANAEAGHDLTAAIIGDADEEP